MGARPVGCLAPLVAMATQMRRLYYPSAGTQSAAEILPCPRRLFPTVPEITDATNKGLRRGAFMDFDGLRGWFRSRVLRKGFPGFARLHGTGCREGRCGFLWLTRLPLVI